MEENEIKIITFKSKAFTYLTFVAWLASFVFFVITFSGGSQLAQYRLLSAFAFGSVTVFVRKFYKGIKEKL